MAEKEMQPLGLDQIQSVATSLRRDIVTSAVALGDDIFSKFMINVLTGIKFRDAMFVHNRKGGTTRRYEPGDEISSQMGYIEERELEVTVAWNRYDDNIENYREKEPFQMNPAGLYEYPNTELALRSIGDSYGEDVLSCLFFGDKSLPKSDPMGLYDGFYSHIDKAINLGKISEKLGNFIKLGEIDLGMTGNDDTHVYDIILHDFYMKLNPSLKKAKNLIFAMSPELRLAFIRCYANAYPNIQSEAMTNENYKFVGMENVKVVSDPIVGIGTKIVATRANNLDYGVDTLDKKTKIEARGDVDKDFNIVHFQVQSPQGTRIRNINSGSFCTTDAVMVREEQLQGDYREDTFTANSSNENVGTVSVSPNKENYVKGEVITVTATVKTENASTHEFKGWSDDGSKENPKKIVYKGFPTGVIALFGTKPSSE